MYVGDLQRIHDRAKKAEMEFNFRRYQDLSQRIADAREGGVGGTIAGGVGGTLGAALGFILSGGNPMAAKLGASAGAGLGRAGAGVYYGGKSNALHDKLRGNLRKYRMHHAPFKQVKRELDDARTGATREDIADSLKMAWLAYNIAGGLQEDGTLGKAKDWLEKLKGSKESVAFSPSIDLLDNPAMNEPINQLWPYKSEFSLIR